MKSGNPIKSDKIILLVAGLTFAVITIVTIATEETPGWKYYQSEFKYEVVDAGQADAIDKIPSGIQQIWVKGLNRVDRCITCHQGIFWIV